jgi:hypothetical protein
MPREELAPSGDRAVVRPDTSRNASGGFPSRSWRRWHDLLETDWAAARSLMRTPVLFDGRNLLDPDDPGPPG